MRQLPMDGHGDGMHVLDAVAAENDLKRARRRRADPEGPLRKIITRIQPA